MKKILLSLFALALVYPCAGARMLLKPYTDTMYIDGEAYTVKPPYITAEGVTLVPLRVIIEAFGAEVVWNDAERSVLVARENDRITLQIDSTRVRVNGEDQTLAAAPVLEGDTTMVPIRFFAEAFGFLVDYNEETTEITISGPGKKAENQYVNFVGQYSLTLLPGWSADDRLPDCVRFSKGGDAFSIQLYNNASVYAAYDTLLGDFYKRIDSYGVSTKPVRESVMSRRLIGNSMAETETASFSYDGEKYRSVFISFEQGLYTYAIQGIFKGGEAAAVLSEIYEMLQTAFFEPIGQNKPEIHKYNFVQRHTDTEGRFKIAVPLGWDVDFGEGTCTAGDGVYEVKIELVDPQEFIEEKKKEALDRYDPYARPKDMDDYLLAYYDKLFYEKKGAFAKLKYKPDRRMSRDGMRIYGIELYDEYDRKLVSKNYYSGMRDYSVEELNEYEEFNEYRKPTDIPNFAGSAKVYPFFQRAAEEENPLDMPLYYVFRKGELFVTATCKRDGLLNGAYHRGIYDGVIKSVAQEL